MCSKTIDALNDVILEKGDVVDVLDRTKGSHWLVRKDHAKDEVSEFQDIFIMGFFSTAVSLMIWGKNMQDNRIKPDFTFVHSAYLVRRVRWFAHCQLGRITYDCFRSIHLFVPGIRGLVRFFAD